MKFAQILSLFLLAAPLTFTHATFAQDNNDAGTSASAADTTSAGGAPADTSHDVDTPRTDRAYNAQTSRNISDAANRNSVTATRAADQDAETDPNAPNLKANRTTEANSNVQYAQEQRTIETQSGISTFWWAMLAVLAIVSVGYGVTQSRKHPRV